MTGRQLRCQIRVWGILTTTIAFFDAQNPAPSPCPTSILLITSPDLKSSIAKLKLDIPFPLFKSNRTIGPSAASMNLALITFSASFLELTLRTLEANFKVGIERISSGAGNRSFW